MQQQKTNYDRIVFYDGDCMLCAKTVRFLLKADRKKKLHFAPLGGNTSKQLEVEVLDKKQTSVLFYHNGKLYDQSTAALHITRELPFPFSLFFLLIAIPPFIRDAIYQFVGRNRYKWFGKTNYCTLYDSKIEGRILD